MKLLTCLLLLLASIVRGKEASEHYEVVYHREEAGGGDSCVIEDRKSGKVLHDLSSLITIEGNPRGLRNVCWADDERHVLISYYNGRWDDEYVLVERRGQVWHELKLPDFPKCGLRLVKPDDDCSSYIQSAEWRDNQRLILGHDVRIGDWHHPALRFAANEQLQVQQDEVVARNIIGHPVPFDDGFERSEEVDAHSGIQLVESGKRIKLLRNEEILVLFDDVLKSQLGIKQVCMEKGTALLNLPEQEQNNCCLIGEQLYASGTAQLYFRMTAGRPERQAWYAYEIKTGKIGLLFDHDNACSVIREVNSLKMRAEGRVLEKIRWRDGDARLSKSGELVVDLVDDLPEAEEVHVEARVRLIRSRVALTACDVIR